jgi:serine/threonine protein kinase
MQYVNQDDIPRKIKLSYSFVKVVGSGAYGVVCLYEKSGAKFAVKLESTLSHYQSLTQEALYLKKINGLRSYLQPGQELLVPRYYEHGLVRSDRDSNITFNYLIMDYLDLSLEEFLEVNHYQEHSFGQISKMMLKCMESLHRVGYIHRDVKPDNFRVKDGKAYLVDFGQSREFRNANGDHIPFATGRQMKGTPFFISIFAHQGHEVSRRDDIISLMYSVMYLKDH